MAYKSMKMVHLKSSTATEKRDLLGFFQLTWKSIKYFYNKNNIHNWWIFPKFDNFVRCSNERDDDESSTNKKKPSSCEELKAIGHTLDGFYTVQGTETTSNQLKSIYCDFSLELSDADASSKYHLLVYLSMI